MRRKGLTIFWPQYFDLNRSIRLGRRVPRELAISRPTSLDLYEAAQHLKYYVEHDKTARYPRTSSDHPGRVLIDTMGQKKTFVMHKLAPEIKKVKQKRKDAAQLAKRKKKHRTNKEILQEKLRKKQYAKKKKK
ncbi:MAG: signal recognition particle subunit SRP19/SEC65 family protein [Candidatus Lokiarchaeota archaeon]|nr:signal recognition particle subunit SRP19/SEC65 family protein [Candidatus Harpocratesius repetitus]